jgi:hypothetical protein
MTKTVSISWAIDEIKGILASFSQDEGSGIRSENLGRKLFWKESWIESRPSCSLQVGMLT